MVRLSTQYDKDVGKVFMVRGDEAYARTTNTKLEIIDDATNSRDAVEGYRCGFKYDVLRDLGSSSVVLCNGEDELAQYDWSSNDGERYVGVLSNHTTIDPNTCLTLAYGVEHQLYMKYKGNKQCLKSKSRIITIHEPLPDKFKTELDMTYNITNQGVVLTITVTVNGQHIPATHNKTIEIYVDDELVDTATTGANTNVATKTLQLASGKDYNVTAVLQGDETIHIGSASVNIPIGIELSFIEKPSVFVMNEENTFKVRVANVADIPLPNVSVTLGELSSTTDSLGVATFNVTSPFFDNRYQAVYGDYRSEEVVIPVYVPSLKITQLSGTNMYSTHYRSISLSISANISRKDIPITLIARNYDWNNGTRGNDIVFHKVYTTGSDGKVTIDLKEEDPNLDFTRRVISAYLGTYPDHDVSTEENMIIDKVIIGKWDKDKIVVNPSDSFPELGREIYSPMFNQYDTPTWEYDCHTYWRDEPATRFRYEDDWVLEYENAQIMECSSISIYVSDSDKVNIPKQASPSSLKFYKKGSTLKIYRNNVLISSHNYTRTDEPMILFNDVPMEGSEGRRYTRLMKYDSMRYMNMV